MSSNPSSEPWPDSPSSNRISTRRSAQVDFSMLAVVVVLTLFGLLTILTASAPTAEFSLGNSLFYFQRQALWAVIGFAALFFGASMGLGAVRRLAKPFLLLVGLLLLLVQVPGVGVEELGSARWLRIGPISLQPSELAKLAIAIYGADMLARHGLEGLAKLRQVAAPLAGMCALVFIQPDLGTTIVLALTAFVLFFCSGAPLRILGGVAFTAVLGVLYTSWTTPYQRERWLGFLDPWADPQGRGFQLVQSLMAIGSGGVFGEGWGQGKQKLFWLPIQYTDFIFAVLAEEMGLIGSLFVVATFLMLAWRGFAIAGAARDDFHSLLVIALTTIVVAQAFINIGVVTASLPTTGIPLPFLSYGGTSLAVTLFSMGLILNVSRQTRRQIAVVGDRPEETS